MPHAVHVWLPLPLPGFDFLVPHEAPDAAVAGPSPVGARIAVPWQGGVRVGVVAAVREVGGAAALDLRPAVAWLAGAPLLGAPALAVLAAQAARCAVPVGVVLAGAGVLGLRGPFVHEVRRDPSAPVALLGPDGAALADGGWVDAATLPAEALAAWRDHGLVGERVSDVRARERRLVAARPADAALDGAARAGQRAALTWLEEHGASASAAALARDAGVPDGAARALVAKGYAAYADLETPDPPPPWATSTADGPLAAARQVAGGRPSVGGGRPLGADVPAAGGGSGDRLVTGGAAVDRFAVARDTVVAAVAAGGQALWLVPEQAAAEAVAGALAADAATLRWPADGDEPARLALAREVARGTPAVVVGTFPTLLLPFADLREVVVWDAASASYKGFAGARSVARVDARTLATAVGARRTVVDPLATVELRAEAVGGAHLELPRARPRAALVDLRVEPGWPLAAPLVRLLKQVAERGRQALLLVPRRGYAAALGCRACGEVELCPNCDLPLRWHARVGRLRCHRCGVERGAPVACTACGATDLEPRPGAGTEWVARALREAVPDLIVVQWDRDRRDDPEPLLAGAPGAIVGTTGALRAPPLPHLALVALTSGDALLDHEDVRATETALRTLLALPDLATGARRPLLVAQVHRPEHEVWRAWTSDDLDAAVARVLDGVDRRRAAYGYPPYRRWARVQVTHRDRGQAAAAARAVVDRLKASGVPADDLLGPAPTPVARARGRYAFHAFLRADDDATLADRVHRVDPRPLAGAVVRVDVDPYDVEGWLD